MLASPQIETLTSGIDWITATLPKDAPNDQTWINAALDYLETVVNDGNELEYRDLLGYSGVGAAGCFVGTREDGHMAVFAGHYAHQATSVLYRSDMHVSRLDIQVSVQFDRMPINIGKKGYRDAIRANDSLPAHRRRKIWIIVGSDNGDTVYVGSSSSEQRGCLYNKEVQSEDPLYSRTWRYEVRLKNGAAMAVLGRYVGSRHNQVHFVAELVATWYESRGIEAPWPYDENAVPIPPQKTLPSDVERKLNWLRTQVRPSIKFLLQTCDRQVILQELGLITEDTRDRVREV